MKYLELRSLKNATWKINDKQDKRVLNTLFCLKILGQKLIIDQHKANFHQESYYTKRNTLSYLKLNHYLLETYSPQWILLTE